MAYLLEIAARGRELFIGSNPDEKRELLGLLGSNLLLRGEKVEITLYSPFNTLASCNEQSVWLGKWFLFQTFDELDSVRDKESNIQQTRHLLGVESDSGVHHSL